MWTQYVDLVDSVKVKTIIILILADFLLGIIVALKNRNFQWSRLAQFLNTSVLPFVLGYFVVGLVGLVETDWAAIVPAAWIVVDISLLALIAAKLKDLGLPIPKIPGL